MLDSQDDIDALLAEVNSLAEEAIADILAQDQAKAAAPAPEPVAVGGPQAHITGSGAQHAPARRRSSSPPGDIGRILKLEVPVIVQLAERTMPLADIMSLSTGSIIEFEKPSDSELDLMINNKRIGTGQAVKVGENFGLRVTAIGSLRNRIIALSKS